MAYTVWTGGVSGNVTTAGNWDTGAAPANGDEVIIRGTSTVDLDTNLAGLTAITADSIDVMSDFTANIGTSSGTQFDISATQLNYFGRGEFAYFTGTYTRVNSDCGHSTQAFNLDGTVTTLVHRGGNLTLDAGVAITNCVVNGPRARLVAPVGIGTFTTLQFIDGLVRKQCAVTTVYQSGGTLENINGNITTLILSGGPNTVFKFLRGTITTLIMNGGTLDLRQTGYARTITTLWANDGTIDAREVGNTLTLTNGYRIGGDRVRIMDPTGSFTRALS